MPRTIRSREDFDDALKRIGSRVRDLRAESGLTQTALSELALVPQSSISLIENGAMDVQIVTLLRLSRAFGVSISSLVDPN
jgi:transcriptional regulator with XRE-family HTH domain